jgi:hypothetical protein
VLTPSVLEHLVAGAAGHSPYSTLFIFYKIIDTSS